MGVVQRVSWGAFGSRGLVVFPNARNDYGFDHSWVGSLVRVLMDIFRHDRSRVDECADIRQREVFTALPGFFDKLERSMNVAVAPS